MKNKNLIATDFWKYIYSVLILCAGLFPFYINLHASTNHIYSGYNINNIIDNAIKYGDKIHVDLSKSTNNLFIKIEDNGPGIPKEEYDNVFKPFYKINKGRADSKSSVGLGLSIASDIIRSHGGNIKLEKSSMNGLGVKIFLPV